MEHYNYKVGDKRYSVSHRDLVKYYEEYVKLSSAEFMERLPEILHLVCIVSYIDDFTTKEVLSDEGLLHQLIHLLHIPDEPMIVLNDIMTQFEVELNWLTQKEF